MASQKSPNVGTFSKMYTHGYICMVCKCCITRINFKKNLDLGSKSP